MSFWLQGLNPEQQEAVSHNEGPLLILAGAGSGKTTVLVSRTGRLIEEKKAKPEKIGVLTFTNKAAQELKHRVELKLGKSAKKVWSGTFHGFGLQFLKKHWKEAGLPQKFGVIDSSDSIAILKDLVKSVKAYEKSEMNMELLLSKITYFRQYGHDEKNDPTIESAASIVLAPKYVRRMRDLGVVDFEELLLRPLQMVAKSEILKQELQTLFDYMMVDEFQDTNSLQMKLVDVLSGERKNIAVVGDDDQSIYGWRGAQIQNILTFPSRYKQCRVIRLERNYRSSEKILNMANAVISNNKNRHGKVLRAAKDNEGELPELFVFENEHIEVEEVVRELHRFHGLGYAWKDIAILYRSNSQGGLMEGGLRAADIPYNLTGGTALFERKEAKDVLAYIRSSVYPTEVGFRRILNLPPRGVGEKSIEQIEAYDDGKLPFHVQAQRWGVENLQEKAGQGITDLFQFLKNLKKQLLESGLSAEDVLNSELTAIGYRQYVNTSYRDLRAADSRWITVNIVGRILDGMFYRHGRTIDTLEKFIDCMELRDLGNEDKNDADVVQLMTLHACKGLEFPLVFLIGLEEDILPHIRLGSDIDEERRLLYVGVTRAQKHLVLTRVRQRKRYGKFQLVSPSRFLIELDSALYSEMQDCRPMNVQSKENMFADFFKNMDAISKDKPLKL